MQAILYVNNSDANKIDKDLTTVTSVNVILKDDTDNLTPILIMSPNIQQTFNYVYLADFDRYYFVNSVSYSQQRYLVSLSVDVLMSYASDIKSLTVIADRSSSRFNLYQTDGEISFLNKNDIITLSFPKGFNGTSMILAVNGGNSNSGGE